MAKTLCAASANDLLARVDYILLDIDGVLWSGDHVFDGIPETIAWLRACGKKIRFLSNNSTMSRETTAQKFLKKGIPGVTAEEIYTSAYAAALHLKSSYGDPRYGGLVNTNIFVLGEAGLHQELRTVLAPGRFTYGLELNGSSYTPANSLKSVKQKILPPPQQLLNSGSAERMSVEDLNCGVVVAGLDFGFNMAKLACAGLVLQMRPNSGFIAAHDQRVQRVAFVATNEDPQLPIGQEGYLFPGAGCVVGALSTVAGRPPDCVCGKPHQMLAKILFEHEGLRCGDRCLMVGDRLTTDIAFGNRAGCHTLMVLTGCEGLADVDRAIAQQNRDAVPQFTTQSLADLKKPAVGSRKSKL